MLENLKYPHLQPFDFLFGGLLSCCCVLIHSSDESTKVDENLLNNFKRNFETDLIVPHGLWDFSYLTKEKTQALSSESKVLTTGQSGNFPERSNFEIGIIIDHLICKPRCFFFKNIYRHFIYIEEMETNLNESYLFSLS